MKSSTIHRFLCPSSTAFPILMLAQCLPVMAQTGTWSDTGNGPSNWSNSSRWSGGVVANGSTFTANLTSNIGQLCIIDLDSSRTLGNLTLSDNATSGSPWLIRGNNTLTFDNGASQAIITKTTPATISAPISGSNLRINGGATMVLAGNNTGITGAVTLGGVNGVTLTNSNALGSSTINFAAAEVLSGTTRGIAINNPVTLTSTFWQGAFGLTLNGSLTLNANNQGFNTFLAVTDTVQAGPVVLGSNNLAVAGGAVGGIRISGNISGAGGLAKSGSSTLTLSGSNSYAGATTVTAGRLDFNASANTSDITVSGANTVLGGEGSSSNSITLGTGTILAFNPTTSGSLNTTGAVTVDASVNLAFEPTQPLTDGANTIDVLRYGTLTGFSNLVIPTGLRSATLNDDTANSKVTLSLTTGTRVWSYNEANEFADWDVLTTNNWSGGDSLFANGDSVTFNDTSDVGNISLFGQVRPAAITFDNSDTDFTITPLTPGTDLIAGAASVTKLGTGTATLAGSNSFTGGATIQAGTLGFANGGLGTYGPITMDGGRLRWHGSNTQDISRRLFLVDGKAATFDTAANNVSFNTSLGGGTTTTASVVKQGSGILTITNTNSPGTYSGGTVIDEGTLSLGTGGTGNLTCSPAALGSGPVTINSGARLRLWIQNTHTHNITNNLTINGGRLHGEDGVYNINGTVAVGTAGATFSGVWGGKNLQIIGVISGDGPVTIESGGSQVRFFANNTYTGATTISNGSLLLNGTDATSGYTVASGATLVLRNANISGDISGPGTVTKDISTFGSSTINGDNNTYTGPTTVNIDRLTLGSSGVIDGTSGITVQAQWGANFNNLGSVTTPGNITVQGSGNNTSGGVSTDSSFFRNAGTVNAANLLLNSSASTNTTANRGGTYSQSAGSTTLTGAVTMSLNGGTGAAGTAGNDAALNLSGGSLTTPALQLNSGTLTASGGTLTLGSGGISSTGTAPVVANLGAVTLAASAPWTTTVSAALTESTTATTVDTTGGNITLGGILTGTGNLLKTGTGTLEIPAANTFTGTTTVTGGVLAVDGNSLVDSTSLVIDGGRVNPSGGNEVVDTLFFGTTQKAAGTWGASGSGATFIDDARFTGTGVVTVTSGPASGYSTWAMANAGNGAADEDFDKDGVPNAVEYFFGETGSTFTANPGLVAGKVTWPKDPTAVATYVVQTSTNLTSWATATTGVVDNGTSVEYTIPTGDPVRFARIVVTIP
ncbi:MAG: toxins and related Ca2+-binding domain [Verrucomicrobiota bacterium]|jgi:autotransporter-associated beta strand protein